VAKAVRQANSSPRTSPTSARPAAHNALTVRILPKNARTLLHVLPIFTFSLTTVLVYLCVRVVTTLIKMQRLAPSVLEAALFAVQGL